MKWFTCTYKNPAPIRLGYSTADGRTDSDTQTEYTKDRGEVFTALSDRGQVRNDDISKDADNSASQTLNHTAS